MIGSSVSESSANESSRIRELNELRTLEGLTTFGLITCLGTLHEALPVPGGAVPAKEETVSDRIGNC